MDEVSSLNLYLKGNSVYTGAISNEGEVYVEIQAGSKWVLTEDSYITSLTCEADSIDLNGHKLYVNGEEITINNATPPEREDVALAEPLVAVDAEEEINLALIIAIVAAGSLAIAAVIVAIYGKKSRRTKDSVKTEDNDAVITSNSIKEDSTVDKEPHSQEQEFPKDIEVNDISPTDKE